MIVTSPPQVTMLRGCDMQPPPHVPNAKMPFYHDPFKIGSA
jgi:hypothetical protein